MYYNKVKSGFGLKLTYSWLNKHMANTINIFMIK